MRTITIILRQNLSIPLDVLLVMQVYHNQVTCVTA